MANLCGGLAAKFYCNLGPSYILHFLKSTQKLRNHSKSHHGAYNQSSSSFISDQHEMFSFQGMMCKTSQGLVSLGLSKVGMWKIDAVIPSFIITFNGEKRKHGDSDTSLPSVNTMVRTTDKGLDAMMKRHL